MKMKLTFCDDNFVFVRLHLTFSCIWVRTAVRTGTGTGTAINTCTLVTGILVEKNPIIHSASFIHKRSTRTRNEMRESGWGQRRWSSYEREYPRNEITFIVGTALLYCYS